MAEQGKRGGCLKVAGVGLGALVVLGVIGTLAGGGGADAPGTEASSAPALAISARDLHAAFDANEVAAKARFDGQRLAVTGTISSISLDFMDRPVVALETANQFQAVQATFAKDAAAATGALAKGQEITVTCGSVTEVVGVPVLGDCALH